MKNKVLLAIITSTLVLSGCPKEDVKEGETNTPTPVFSSLCKNHLDALEGQPQQGQNAYPLRILRQAGEITLENGGFENPALGANAIAHNSDPVYVYAGEGSAQLTGEVFRASVYEDEHYTGRTLKSLSFWLYSANDNPVDFILLAAAWKLDRIDGNDGHGYSGHTQSSELLITADPHQWVKVQMDLQTPEQHECLQSITLEPRDGSSVSFYIDEINLEAELVTQ